jgi:aldose 1-epimerase
MHTEHHWLRLLSTILAAGALAGCATTGQRMGSISKKPFGNMPDGRQVDIFTLRNDNGMEARITDYGGIVVSLKVPDRYGHFGDVVLGYDNLPQYLTNTTYFGALIGRYGNRIARGKFTLDGKQYNLATNNFPNALHGGIKGFDKVLWEPTILTSKEGPALQLHYLSKNGDQGYPGNLDVTATYSLTPDNGLKLEYVATTDQDTIINLTQHSYFNLAGHGTILNHVLTIPADDFTPVDSTLIPTGKLEPVAGTPLDFRKPTPIGARIHADNQQLKYAGGPAGGYDFNWVINKPLGQYGLVARVYEPASGRILEAFSNQPGLQFYSGNFLDGTIIGKGGWLYERNAALTLEPQYYPDSPNHPNFPSTELKPGEVYHNVILYRFSVYKQ